ncbi:MAG: DNA adenine methylase [Clostridia bacterium]|nr:DNA adenine methylase [Clostridia bacterium]
MTDIIKKLQEVNWDFSDYSRARYPYDLNSIPWYPAMFVPAIPKFLIASLTKPGDVVFDPFGGSGTTLVESLKLNRTPIYNDLNSFAVDMVQSMLASIKHFNTSSKSFDLEVELKKLKEKNIDKTNIEKFIKSSGINKDVLDWYHIDTLTEILSIINFIKLEQSDCLNNSINLIRKLAVTSILKTASSQPGHFTYVTDNCKPKNKVYKNAINLYIEKLEQIFLSAEDFLIQFNLVNSNVDITELLQKTIVKNGDARNLDWIDDKSIDLIVTSPPYLCSQDYIKTMRLTNLFFPNEETFSNTVKDEIGPRAKRNGKSELIVPKFYQDLGLVFNHIKRILKQKGYFCLVMGQGKSKITANYDIILDLCEMIQHTYGFEKVFHQRRNIVNREIPIGGVDKEDIIIFQKV